MPSRGRDLTLDASRAPGGGWGGSPVRGGKGQTEKRRDTQGRGAGWEGAGEGGAGRPEGTEYEPTNKGSTLWTSQTREILPGLFEDVLLREDV